MDSLPLVEVVEKAEDAVAGIDGRERLRSSSEALEDASFEDSFWWVACELGLRSGLLLRTRCPRSDLRCSTQLDGPVADDCKWREAAADKDWRSCCFRARLRCWPVCLSLWKLVRLFNGEPVSMANDPRPISIALLLPLPLLGVSSSVPSSDEEDTFPGFELTGKTSP